jgi:hypothetical protein
MCVVLGGILILVAWQPGAEGSTSNIRRAYRTSPGLVGLSVPGKAFKNAVDVAIESAARNVPIPASQTAYTYRRTATGVWERSEEGGFGPLYFMERAQPLGEGKLNVGITGQYLELFDYDGDRVGEDPFPIIVDGISTRFRGSQKYLYHVFTLNLTYGVTQDLDLNVAVPTTAIDADVNGRRQDVGSPQKFFNTEHAHVSFGVMDILLRAKYHLFDWNEWSGAAGFAVRLPTGETSRGLGTGDGELGPFLAFSVSLLDGLVNSHWNASYDLNVTHARLSSASYGWGIEVKPCAWFSVGGSVRGRSEVHRRRSRASVSGPHVTPSGIRNTPYLGIDPERKDYFDADLGVTVQLSKNFALRGGVMRAINDDGLRARGWSPIGSLQATF